MISCLSHTLNCGPRHKQGMCPDWESNWQPLGTQASTQSTGPHQPGHCTTSLPTSSGTRIHFSNFSPRNLSVLRPFMFFYFLRLLIAFHIIGTPEIVFDGNDDNNLDPMAVSWLYHCLGQPHLSRLKLKLDWPHFPISISQSVVQSHSKLIKMQIPRPYPHGVWISRVGYLRLYTC